MNRTRLLLLVLALLVASFAIPAPDAEADHHSCWCEIYCLDYGYQVCYQDSCCNFYCCYKDDPNCWLPC